MVQNLSARLLQKELSDILKNDELSQRITVGLIDDDLHKWSVTMRASSGHWKGCLTHLHITFPVEYPTCPPKVQLMTELPGQHPNVFSWGICLDMLTPSSEGAFQGWSPAYRADSLLMQLAGFLIDDESIGQAYGKAVARASTNASTSSISMANERTIRKIQTCPCGMHHIPPEVGDDPADAMPEVGKDRGKDTSIPAAVSPLPGPDLLRQMPEDCLQHVLVNVESPQDLLKLQRALVPPGSKPPSPPSTGKDPSEAIPSSDWIVWKCVLDALQRQRLKCYVVRDAETSKEEWGDLLGLGKKVVIMC